MTHLLDPDLEFGQLSLAALRALVASQEASVLRRGRALMELGRRASGDQVLLPEVAVMIRDLGNRRQVTVGTVSVSQLGVAGLVAGGEPEAIAMARELVAEWEHAERSDFAQLMRSAGDTSWP